MPTTFTPLRYPGGKTAIYPYVKKILIENNLLNQTYIEPFAGGAGLAIKLLIKNEVKRIVINDYDTSIYSFWFSVLNYTKDFCNMINEVEVTIDEWEKQREIYIRQDISNPLELGFATFFLNRTNISGVIKGGMIGGHSQNGKYKLNARFNKETLTQKIISISIKKSQIFLYNLDVIDFVKSDVLGSFRKCLINFDPPYVKKGAQLYKNSFTDDDHIHLSNVITNCNRKWIVTYDICPLIEDLYGRFRHDFLDITYSVRNTKRAQEFIFFSDNLIVPNNLFIES